MRQVLDCAHYGTLGKGKEIELCMYPEPWKSKGKTKAGAGDICEGGFPDMVIDWVASASDLASDTGYPYVFGTGKPEDHMNPATGTRGEQACGANRQSSDPYPETERRKVYGTRYAVGEAQIMRAVMASGAVTAGFKTFQDIFSMTKSTGPKCTGPSAEPCDMSKSVYRPASNDNMMIWGSAERDAHVFAELRKRGRKGTNADLTQ